MPYSIVYRVKFYNQEGIQVFIHVSDTLSGQFGESAYFDLEGVEAEIKIVSDEDSKYGIKSKRLVFSFKSTDTYSLKTFLPGDDDRWYVEAFMGDVSNPIFIGYLVMDDTTERFQPANTFTVELTASDNLGLLRDIPLTNATGVNPRGAWRLIDYVTWCLRKINLELDLKVVYNLFPEQYNGADHATFDKVFLDSKTFETDINVSENCYSVLQKILHGCFLTQENGSWWIVRVDEINNNSYRIYNFTFTGVYTGHSFVTLEKLVGRNQTIKLTNRDADVNPQRGVKFVEQDYHFEFPRELICNFDFSRGAFSGVLAPPNTTDYLILRITTAGFPTTGDPHYIYLATGSGIYYQWLNGAYVPMVSPPLAESHLIECWTAGRIAGSVQTTPYIRVKKVNGYETERVVIIESTSGGGHYIASSLLQVNISDKFVFSVDRKFNVDIGGGTGTTRDAVAQIRLYGDDGTYWMLNGQNFGTNLAGDWVQSNLTFTVNARTIDYVWDKSATDEREWQTVSVEARPVPRSGTIQIFLQQSALFFNQVATFFSNMRFDYIPIIGGVYQKFSGQYHKVSNLTNQRSKEQEDVFISDAPSINFKGALQVMNGLVLVLAGRWYNYNAGITGELGLEKFGKYQVYELWNQRNRIMRKIQGSLLGLDSSSLNNLPGLLHRYKFTAPSEHTTNKIFALLSYSQNLQTCKWSGVFEEVFDTVIGKDYTSLDEFKYLT